MFVAGALEHDRPFLAPLYKFLTLHTRNAVRRIPSYVAFILEFLSRSVSSNRHYDCNEFLEKSGVVPRVDAQARMEDLIDGRRPGSLWRFQASRFCGFMNAETSRLS